MDHLGIIILMYVAGMLLLVAEVFVPSHGLLTVAALVCMGIAVYQTFGRDTTAGVIGTACCLVAVPTVLMTGIKYVRYLPMGDRLAPPNPTDRDKGHAFDSSEIESLVGVKGKSITPLRPCGDV